MGAGSCQLQSGSNPPSKENEKAVLGFGEKASLQIKILVASVVVEFSIIT